MNHRGKIPLVDLTAQHKELKKEINSAITSVIASSSFIMGEESRLFEEEFAKFLSVKHAVGVSSGSEALRLSLIALGVRSRDEVITVPNTFTATAEAICLCGAKPIFVDVDPSTYNIDPKLIEGKITSKTVGIIPVHLYGQSADMNPIMKIARKKKLFVLEDSAQAHGALYRGKMVGTIGDIGIFSFFPAKNLGALGDGGAVVTNNDALAEKVKLLRNHGRQDKYLHKVVGYGARLDNIQAAILRIKLRHLKRWNLRRREITAYYNKLLKNLPLLTPLELAETEAVYHIYCIRVKNRDLIRQTLKSKGIETGIHYPIPLHLQPAYKSLGYKKGDFPQTEKVVEEILSLPIYPEMTDPQVEFVSQYIAHAIKELYTPER